MTADVAHGPRRGTRSVRRPAAGVAVVLVGAAALVACAGPAPGTRYVGEAVPVTPGVLTARDVADASTALGFDLLAALCAEHPGENLLISPTSASQALGLVQPAAGGTTAQGVADVLHLPSWSPDLVAALRAQTTALAGLGEGGDEDDTVRLSNRVWTDMSVDPTQDYLDAVATAYDAGLEALDLAGDPAGATDRINAVVADDTAGLIPELLAEPLPPAMRVVLTNAVHLRADWATEFGPAQPGRFDAPGGPVGADLMPGGAGAARFSDDGWVEVEIPYEDGTLVAVAVLPPEGTDPCAVDAARLAAVADGDQHDVAVTLPRLHLEQTHELLEALVALGLPVRGDFSGFGAREPLVLTRVVQGTFLEVDEHGTEAAAATAVGGEAGAAPPSDVVVLDRPFLLLLTDVETRSPLFLGVVQDPTAG